MHVYVGNPPREFTEADLKEQIKAFSRLLH